MNYKCIKCNKEFHQKSNYEVHMKRKYSCNKNYNHTNDVNDNNIESVQNSVQSVHFSVQNSVQSVHGGVQSVQNVNQVNQSLKLSDQNNATENKTYGCLYCNKKYLSSQALSKHKKKHNIDNNIDNNMSYDDLLEKYNNMENKLIELSDIINKQSNNELNKQTPSDKAITTKSHNTKHVNSHNTTNTQNISAIKNLNIHIANYGSEYINKLTNEEQQKIINSKYDAIYTMLELLHHNPRLKEYHNVYDNNLRSKNIHLYSNGRFIVENKKKTIEQMISNMAYNIETIANQTKPISSKQKKLLHDNFNWLKDFEINIEDAGGNFIRNDQKLIEKYKNIYNKYETLLYNNRNFAIDTYNLNKKTQLLNNEIANELIDDDLLHELENEQNNYVFTDV
jgi:hypothetical protein